MKVCNVLVLTLVMLLAACTQLTTQRDTTRPVDMARFELRRDGGITTLTAPTLDTAGLTALFEQYDLEAWPGEDGHPTYRMMSTTGILADDFGVPEGDSWHVTHLGFIGAIQHADLFDHVLRVYRGDTTNGGPGELLASRALEAVSEQVATPEFSTFYLFVLSEPLTVDAGNYWLGIRAGDQEPGDDCSDPHGACFHLSWQAVVGDATAEPQTQPWHTNEFWLPLPIDVDNLAFGLYQADGPAAQEVIDAFDVWVGDDELLGAGAGASAACRLNALRNMLVGARDLLDAGDRVGACAQLADASKRVHVAGRLQPSHFVTGPAAAALHELIERLRGVLGC